MKVLVTGSEGFIGSHLVEELVGSGHEVRAFVHYNFRGLWGWLDDLSPAIHKSVEVVMGVFSLKAAGLVASAWSLLDACRLWGVLLQT